MANLGPTMNTGDPITITRDITVRRLSKKIEVVALDLVEGDTGIFLRYDNHPMRGERAFVELSGGRGRFNVPLSAVKGPPARTRFEILEDM